MPRRCRWRCSRPLRSRSRHGRHSSRPWIWVVRTSAQMAFRPVLVEGTPTPTDTAPTPEPTESAAATDPAAPARPPRPPQRRRSRRTSRPRPRPTTRATPRPASRPRSRPSSTPWTARTPTNLTGGVNGDPDKAFVTCGQDGSAKYILGPVEIEGARISSATSGLNQLPSGGTGNSGSSTSRSTARAPPSSRDVTTRLQGLAATPPLNQFAMVLDGLVISAPSLDTGVIIADGKAEISGTFTRESAASLANQLNFGSLPLTFKVESEEQISATLGSEQLQMGLLAGLIGLGLVVVYSLLQYRALGLVTVASLVVAGVLTYSVDHAAVVDAGLPALAARCRRPDRRHRYHRRLVHRVLRAHPRRAAGGSHAGRGRRPWLGARAPHHPGVRRGQLPGRVVLYVLAVGGVRGFAFTLGLTTLIDVLVVFMFTHPIMQLHRADEVLRPGPPALRPGPAAPRCTRAPVRGPRPRRARLRDLRGSRRRGRAVEDARRRRRADAARPGRASAAGPPV